MTVVDRVRRQGLAGKSVMDGPVYLSGPKPADTKSDLYRLSGIYSAVDLYQVGGEEGAEAGEYSFRLKPFTERGFAPSHRAVGDVVAYHQPGGVENPVAVVNCLARKKPLNGASPVEMGPFAVEAGDRLWVGVAQKDGSTVKYELEVEYSSLATCETWFYLLGYQPGDHQTFYGDGAICDSAGNTYLGYSPSAPNGFLEKRDASGAVVWQRLTVPFQYQGDVAINASGKILSVATNGSMACIDSSGNLLWQRRHDTVSTMPGVGALGDDFVMATTRFIGGDPAFCSGVLRVDSNGNLVWNKDISTLGYQYGIAVDSESNIMTGFAVSSNQPTVCKLSGAGEMLWSREVDGSIYATSAYGHVFDDDGNGYVAFNIIISTNKVLLVKFSPAGAVIWQKIHSSPDVGNHWLWDLEYRDGSLYYTGSYNSVLESWYAAVVGRIDADSGELVWTRRIRPPLPGPQYCELFGFALAPAGVPTCDRLFYES